MGVYASATSTRGSDHFSPITVVKANRLARVQVCEGYFRERRVPFKEITVEKDESAARDVVRKTGQMGVPVVKIGGSWIVGFDKNRIEKELARGGS